jgi:hypothetical protein
MRGSRLLRAMCALGCGEGGAEVVEDLELEEVGSAEAVGLEAPHQLVLANDGSQVARYGHLDAIGAGDEFEVRGIELGHEGSSQPILYPILLPNSISIRPDSTGIMAILGRWLGASAPATHSANVQTSRWAAQSPAFRGPLRARRLETDRTGSV